ncbi:MAG TPA: toll/interleukin-1 receptor domain-containing protein [Chitinophagales bacterium]|nr:toll/interleukin-1 receptor domain-containing protein [Chitinophagales bacterium]HNO29831.1 toll/interleukin-1 receptor domain-containing protein [Chitinophagales bacterium]
MQSKYQILLLGNKDRFKKSILDCLYQNLEALGLAKELFIIIDNKTFEFVYRPNAPAFCLFFGGGSNINSDIKIIQKLLLDAVLILPIVEAIDQFSTSIPEVLQKLNGLATSDEKSIERIVTVVLEGFNLMRYSRRVFISYRRSESTLVATQLFEALESKGFSVFLDTHSIRPAKPFQDELWHKMADTDVVVLLNTSGFMNSVWTMQELAEANAMSIGILQLTWPNHNLTQNAQLSVPIELRAEDFGNPKFSLASEYLSESTVENIVYQVEMLRARSLASRQDKLITEFVSQANKYSIKTTLQPDKILLIEPQNKPPIIIIPTIGVPQAFNYSESDITIRKFAASGFDGAYLLYDHRNVINRWVKHLDWLDDYLPIKTIKILQVDNWLKKF